MKLKLKLPRAQAAPHNADGLTYDCDLAEKILEGDKAALERLIDRHMPALNKYVQHRLGPGHDEQAWQVVRATFDEALKKLGPYARKNAVTPMGYWLIRLSERHLSKYLPRVKSGDSVVLTAGDSDDLAIVRAAMITMPRRYASVLALALFEGMSADSIAHVIGTGQAQALRRLRTALKMIGKKVAPESDEEEF